MNKLPALSGLLTPKSGLGCLTLFAQPQHPRRWASNFFIRLLSSSLFSLLQFVQSNSKLIQWTGFFACCRICQGLVPPAVGFASAAHTFLWIVHEFAQYTMSWAMNQPPDSHYSDLNKKSLSITSPGWVYFIERGWFQSILLSFILSLSLLDHFARELEFQTIYIFFLISVLHLPSWIFTTDTRRPWLYQFYLFSPLLSLFRH